MLHTTSAGVTVCQLHYSQSCINGVKQVKTAEDLYKLLFLHDFRNLQFVVVSIPTSIISTFVDFMFIGISLNLLTLLATSIVAGVIADDAIVVPENICRHMEEGENRWQASLDATKEPGITVGSFTLVPVLTSRLGRIEILRRCNRIDRLLMGFESVANGIKSYVMSTLHWALSHKTITLVSVFLFFIGFFPA